MKNNIYSILLLLCTITISTVSCKKDKTNAETSEIQISAGHIHTLVLKPDNSLWACGSNGDGELGDGTTIHRNSLLKITDGIKAISAGFVYTLVLKTDNSLWACGRNTYGQFATCTNIFNFISNFN